eukprot:jgi/Mesvir1/27006/Mv20713-RA.1
MKKVEDPKSLLVRKAKKLGITTEKPASKFAKWRSRKQKRQLRRAGQVLNQPAVALSAPDAEELDRIRSTIRERRLYHQLVLLKKAVKKAQQLEYRKAMRNAKKSSLAPAAGGQHVGAPDGDAGDVGEASSESSRKKKKDAPKGQGAKGAQLAAAIKAVSIDVVVARLAAEVGLPATPAQGAPSGSGAPLMEAAVARLMHARCVRDQVTAARVAVENPVGRVAKKPVGATQGAQQRAISTNVTSSRPGGVTAGAGSGKAAPPLLPQQRGARGAEMAAERRNGGGAALGGDVSCSGDDACREGDEEASGGSSGEDFGYSQEGRGPNLASISDISLSDEEGEGGVSDYGDDDDHDEDDDVHSGGNEDGDGDDGEGVAGEDRDQTDNKKRKGGTGDAAPGKRPRSRAAANGEAGTWHGGGFNGSAAGGSGGGQLKTRSKEGVKGERGAAKKPLKKKNRLGQRARRKQQELLGSQDKGARDGSYSKNPPAHAKPAERRQVASHGRDRSAGSQQQARGPRAGAPAALHGQALTRASASSKPAAKNAKANPGLPEVLHPSWEAKRKQLEAVKLAVTQRGSGKKVVFGDDSD